jgi:hypothetical protein
VPDYRDLLHRVRVCGRGHGSKSCGPNLMVEGCTHTKQTFWTEDEFTVTTSSGIRELWSPQEERQVSPGHFWLLKFDKVPGRNNCVEKKFKLGTRKYEEYKDVRFGNGNCALVVDVWLHRVDEDDSGLTFEEWDPSADTDASEAPVVMIINSSEVRATGFDLREVLPLQLEEAARGGHRTHGAALKQIHGMGTRRCVLSVDNDSEFRSRCE